MCCLFCCARRQSLSSPALLTGGSFLPLVLNQSLHRWTHLFMDEIWVKYRNNGHYLLVPGLLGQVLEQWGFQRQPIKPVAFPINMLWIPPCFPASTKTVKVPVQNLQASPMLAVTFFIAEVLAYLSMWKIVKCFGSDSAYFSFSVHPITAIFRFSLNSQK